MAHRPPAGIPRADVTTALPLDVLGLDTPLESLALDSSAAPPSATQPHIGLPTTSRPATSPVPPPQPTPWTTPPPHPRMGQVSLRWIHVHMIEETARHVAHADILRELIDGITGS